MSILVSKTLRGGLLGLAALAAATVMGGRAAEASFAFTPAGGSTVQANGFSYFPADALAQGSTAAIAAVAANPALGGTAASNFQLYYQAQISSVQLSPSGNLNLTGTYTAVGSITESVLSVTTVSGQTKVAFGVAQGAAQTGTMAIYYSPSATPDPGAGTGFVNGTPILTATPTTTAAGSSNAFTQTNGVTQAFDISNGGASSGNFPGTPLTIVGFGGFQVNLATQTASASFFPGGVPSVLTLTLGGTANPQFASVAPSKQFQLVGGGTVTPNLGPGSVNGQGADLMLSPTGTITAVPEPTSLCLTGLGLGGLLVFARKRNLLSA